MNKRLSEARGKAGEQGLKARTANVQEQTEKEINELKAAIGEIYVENAILKKP